MDPSQLTGSVLDFFLYLTLVLGYSDAAAIALITLIGFAGAAAAMTIAEAAAP